MSVILSEAGPDDKTIFTIKHAKLYVFFVTLLAKYNQKLSKLLSKKFERSVYWSKYNTKSDTKNTKNEYRHFLEPNFDRERIPDLEKQVI